MSSNNKTAKPPRVYCANLDKGDKYYRQHAIPEVNALPADRREMVQLALYLTYKEMEKLGAIADCNTCKNKIRCLFKPGIDGTLHYEPAAQDKA